MRRRFPELSSTVLMIRPLQLSLIHTWPPDSFGPGDPTLLGTGASGRTVEHREE